MQVQTEQKVFFDGQMRTVSEVAAVWSDNGRDCHYIFTRLGWLLGFEVLPVPDTTPDRYACTFDCIIERLPKKESFPQL